MSSKRCVTITRGGRALSQIHAKRDERPQRFSLRADARSRHIRCFATSLAYNGITINLTKSCCGGDQTGLVMISKFIKPGTVSTMPYNHYSMLKRIEDIFQLGYLGYAGQAVRSASAATEQIRLLPRWKSATNGTKVARQKAVRPALWRQLRILSYRPARRKLRAHPLYTDFNCRRSA